MFFSTKIAVAAALVAGANAALTVNTPAAMIQCQPVSLSWSGSEQGGPYFVALIPGGQASAAPLADLGQIDSSPESYTVALPAGTSVTIRVVDKSGQPQYSDPITIQESSSTSCLSGGSASGSASESASASASESGSASASSGAAGSSGSATPSNAASALNVGQAVGVAGIIAAVMGVVA